MTLSFGLLIFLLIINKILCDCGCPYDPNKGYLVQAIDEYKRKWNMAASDHDKPRWEGDMIINPELLDYWYNPNKVKGRAGYPHKYRWPKNTIPYYINDSISDDNKTIIVNALLELAKKTDNLIKFELHKEIPKLKNYVIVRDDLEDCFATVGRDQKLEPQFVNLAKGDSYCYQKHTIQHEFMHVLGFDHEHNRPDRDKYIKIKWANIELHDCHTFDICSECFTFFLPYDYHSVMHYSDTSAACDKGKKTIVALNASITVGPNPDGATALDILKIRAYYKTSRQPLPPDNDSTKLIPQLILSIIYFMIQYM